MEYMAILCGGDGSRLWPFSRRERPKQFLDLMGCGMTLLQLTAERALGMLPQSQVFAVTTAPYAGIVAEQLPEFAPGNLLVEPTMRNTAPAVLWVARHIAAEDPEGVVAILPSDHIVLRQKEFVNMMQGAFSFVKERGGILCIGTDPKSASTAHRYIQMGNPVAAPEGSEPDNASRNTYEVAAFTGKPDAEMAGIFYDCGEFLWNTGIMVFSAKDLCEIYRHHAPDLWELSETCVDSYRTPGKEEALIRAYSEARSVTVDSILETVPDIYVRRADIGWSDLGSWNALYEMSPKTAEGNVTQNSLVYIRNCDGTLFATGGDKLIVAAGLHDFVVADNGNSLLICPRELEGEMRAAVKSVKTIYGERFV